MDAEKREHVIDALAANDADARVFFWPLSQTGHFEVRHPTDVGCNIFGRSINLPSAFGLTDEMINRVSQVVRRFTDASIELMDG